MDRDSRLFDDEAEEGTEEDAPPGEAFQDSSEEEDGDDLDVYENDGFLARDDEIESDHDNEEDRRRKKKRRRRDDSPDLAEGDFMLLQDAGARLPRRKKKLKRLERSDEDEDDYDVDLALNGSEDRNLFDDEDEEERRERRAREEDVDYESDEMEGFIDDGGRGRRRRRAERQGLVSSEAVRDARSIFGDAAELESYRGMRKLFDEELAQGDAQFPDDGTKMEANVVDQDNEVKTLDPERDAEQVPDVGKLSLGTVAPLTGDLFTSKLDDQIRKADIPETLQLHMLDTKREILTDEEIVKEASWMYKYAFAPDPSFIAGEYNPDAVVAKIECVLRYVYVEKLDIPFIAMYRKDYIAPELIHRAGGSPENIREPQSIGVRGFNSTAYYDFDPKFNLEYQCGPVPGYDDGFGDWSRLWRILDWDKRWAHLEQRRGRLLGLIDKAKEKGLGEDFVEDIKGHALAAETEEVLADCVRHVRVLLDVITAEEEGLGVGGSESDRRGREKGRGQHRRPLRRDLYRTYLSKGYRRLASSFGMSSRNFAENVKGIQEFGEKYQIHVPKEPHFEPLVLAKDFADHLKSAAENVVPEGRPARKVEQDPEMLLAAARHIIATEILAEVRVGEYARSLFSGPADGIFVDAKPTQLAMVEVDAMHPLRPYVSIEGKGVQAFSNSTDFAYMQEAEALQLTELLVRLNQEICNTLETNLENAFRDPVQDGSPLKRLWESQRKLVIEDVVSSLVKRIRNEARKLLEQKTREIVSERLLNAACRRLLVGPAVPRPDMNGSPRVLAALVTLPEDEEFDPIELERQQEADRLQKRKIPKRRPSPVRVTFASLNADGELLDNYEIYGGRWLSRRARDPLPEEMKKELVALVGKLRPELVVVGIGSGGNYALKCRDDLVSVLEDFIFNRKADFFLGGGESKDANYSRSEDRRNTARKYVYLVDDAASRLYAKTPTVSQGLSESAVTLLEKRALGLGRLVQEPLLVYSAIAHTSLLSSLKFHNLQTRLGSNRVLRVLRRSLVRGVATTGVDLNRLMVLPHMRPLLSFVPGLGVRKASQMLTKLENSVAEEGQISCRKDLDGRSILSLRVFLSSAAYLRVRDPDLHPGGSTLRAQKERQRRVETMTASDKTFFALDDTRIHPETYAIALKIADEALRNEQGEAYPFVPTNPTGPQVAEAVMEHTEGLGNLDLEKYAQHLENIGRGKLYSIVQMIAAEYREPYKDRRDPLPCAPEPQATFYIVTGADPLTFRIGTKIAASNCRLTKAKKAIFCDLPNRVTGFLSRSEFSDESVTDEEIVKLVPHGSTVAGVILSFDYERIEARLSSKPSVLKSPTSVVNYTPLYDPSDKYIRDFAQSYGGLRGSAASVARAGVGIATTAQAVNADEVLRRRMMKRQAGLGADVTSSPFYRNVTGAEAIELLRDGTPGEFLIRPGMRKGAKFVFTGVFIQVPRTHNMEDIKGIVHYDVSELKADNGVVMYKIGEVTYDEVEEIIQNFVMPVLANLEEATTHRKFRLGTEKEIEETLRREKQQNGNVIPYCVGISTKFAGYLVLAYIPGTKTVRKEIIKVVPAGYQLRKVLHRDMDALIAWFKTHMSAGQLPASKDPGVKKNEIRDAGNRQADNHRSETAPRLETEPRLKRAPPSSSNDRDLDKEYPQRQPLIGNVPHPVKTPQAVRASMKPNGEEQMPFPPAQNGGRRGMRVPDDGWRGPPERSGIPPTRLGQQAHPTRAFDAPPPGPSLIPSRARQHNGGMALDSYGEMRPTMPPSMNSRPVLVHEAPPPVRGANFGRFDQERPPIPPIIQRGPPPALHRGPPPALHRGPPPDLHRGPPPDLHRGPPPGIQRGPPPRGPSSAGPEWRGQKPIPAWQKELLEKEGDPGADSRQDASSALPSS